VSSSRINVSRCSLARMGVGERGWPKGKRPLGALRPARRPASPCLATAMRARLAPGCGCGAGRGWWARRGAPPRGGDTKKNHTLSLRKKNRLNLPPPLLLPCPGRHRARPPRPHRRGAALQGRLHGIWHHAGGGPVRRGVHDRARPQSDGERRRFFPYALRASFFLSCVVSAGQARSAPPAPSCHHPDRCFGWLGMVLVGSGPGPRLGSGGAGREREGRETARPCSLLLQRWRGAATTPARLNLPSPLSFPRPPLFPLDLLQRAALLRAGQEDLRGRRHREFD